MRGVLGLDDPSDGCIALDVDKAVEDLEQSHDHRLPEEIAIEEELSEETVRPRVSPDVVSRPLYKNNNNVFGHGWLENK